MRPARASTDSGHDTLDTTAVKSSPRSRPSTEAAICAPVGTALASATGPGARTASGVALVTGAGQARRSRPS